MTTPLTYTLEGATAVLRLDDGKANALSHAMLDGLLEALGRAQKEASAVVLAGRPGKFCAGFDLSVMGAGPAAVQGLVGKGAAFLLTLYGLPLPVVSACTGHALAGGAQVLLASDVRVGAAGAFRIGLNETTIGLPLPVLGVEFARDRLSPTELTRATLAAHIYEPEGAAKAGYLDEVVAPEQVLPRALEVAAQLGELSRQAYAATKERLRKKTLDHVKVTLDADMNGLMALFGG